MDQWQFGLYELSQYVSAFRGIRNLKEERDMVVQTLYDDISPTITTVDYETGRWYSQTTRTETMALKIIDGVLPTKSAKHTLSKFRHE